MPAKEADLQELGLRYSAAFWVYMRRVRMVARVSIAGAPCAKLLEREAKALRELIHARESFLQAALSFAFLGEFRQGRVMSRIMESAPHALMAKYDVAQSTYLALGRSLAAAKLGDPNAVQPLLDAETTALQALTDARARLLAPMIT